MRPVPKPDKYVPKHRAPGKHKAERTRARALRTGVAMTGLAAAAVTGVAVAGGLVSDEPGGLAPAAADVRSAADGAATGTGDATAPADAAGIRSGGAQAAGDESQVEAQALEQRSERATVSRSERRTDATKAAALGMQAGKAVTRSEKLSEGDPRDIARALLPAYGFSSDQFGCLDSLYMSESGWRVDADNPTSSAYGIPQALTQLHDLPADYMTSAEAQIRWGLEYIQDAYGTPCSAWSFKQGNGWY